MRRLNAELAEHAEKSLRHFFSAASAVSALNVICSQSLKADTTYGFFTANARTEREEDPVFEKIHCRKPVESRPRFAKIALALALLAALAGVSTTFARDDEKEQGKNEREERGKDEQKEREKHGQAHRAQWRMIGHGPRNTRNQPFERKIGPVNVSHLALKWVATTAGDVSATPAVVNGAVYFGDFRGMLWKLDAETGAVIWSHKVSDLESDLNYTANAGDYARTSPSLAGNTLVVGVIRGSTAVPGPNMLGIDATTGALRWKTQIHPDSHAAMTGSPVLVGDIVITGVSANGASAPATATFRGAIVALNAQTGAILWRTYSLPDNGGIPTGYAGATMFAPPAVDVANGLVFGTFGQTYRKPANVDACDAAGVPCEQPDAYWKSIVAFDLKTGEPRWSYRVQGHEPWMRACGPAAVAWCPAESDGEKWDIGGSGANVMRVKIHRHWRDVVGIGGKSGVYTLLDAKTGEFIWSTLIGPGGDQGGMEWGTAFDGDRIYASITNHHHIPYQLTQNGLTSGPFVTGGSWAALDPETGTILWQKADPGQITLTGPSLTGTFGSWALAPVTSANGIVYASSMAYQSPTAHQMFALDAKTGEILWQYAAGTSVNSGPAVVDGSVYWGSGYTKSSEGGPNPNPKFYAFSIDGQ
jgi:polyvinyl alcohol dehydrogenase (cytochrome)